MTTRTSEFEQFMVAQDVLKVIDNFFEDENVIKIEEWQERNAKYKALTITCIADSHLSFVKDFKFVKFAKQIFEKLDSLFPKRSISGQLYFKEKTTAAEATARREPPEAFDNV